MSALFNKQPNEISTPDYAGDLNQIKQGVMMMSPASSTAKGLLQTSEELDNAAWVDFSEIRYFLEPATRRPAPSVSPRVSLTDEEIQMMQAIKGAGGDSRNYEQEFYIPFKEAVLTGVLGLFRYLGTTLSSEEQVNISIVEPLMSFLLYEDLADIADIYFSIKFSGTSDLWVKQSFFTRIRSHISFGDGDEAGQRLQLFLSIFDDSMTYSKCTEVWKKLKDKLIAEFGAGSEDIGALQDEFTFKPPRPDPEFPFTVFPTGDITTGGINLGLRLVYRQEWRPLGIQRGEVVKTIPLGPKQVEKVSTKIVRRSKVTKTSESLKSTESTTETSDSSKDSSEIVNEASSTMKWNVDTEVEGSVNVGIWGGSAKTKAGISQESTDRNKETSNHLSETMRKTANKVRTETKVVVSTESETTFEATTASEIQNPNDEIAITYVFSKLQRQYEILTKLAEVQNVVMVAEELPIPEKIDFDWVKRNDWIIAKVLLDDSFRDALNSISQETGQPDMLNLTADLKKARDDTIVHMGKFASTASVTAQNIDFAGESQKNFLGTAKEQLEQLRENYLMDLKKYRLLEHIRANILHYCRAIWQQEDPQQRLLRYRKQGLTVPLDWKFQPDIIGRSMGIDEFVGIFGKISKDRIRGPRMSGKYVPDSEGRTIPLVDLVNPAGPIAFYGNYAVYYMRPEYASGSDLMSLIERFKLPYEYNGELMDPVERDFVEKNINDPVTDATIDQCWEDMIDHVPDLKLKYMQFKKKHPDSDESSTAIELLGYQDFRAFYPEYQFRLEMSRRFLVDTNCLMIDLLPGEGSALEPFKQMHRVIDVLKAEQELLKAHLDNERRKDLLSAGKLGDPDIEKVVVVDGKKNIDLVA